MCAATECYYLKRGSRPGLEVCFPFRFAIPAAAARGPFASPFTSQLGRRSRRDWPRTAADPANTVRFQLRSQRRFARMSAAPERNFSLSFSWTQLGARNYKTVRLLLSFRLSLTREVQTFDRPCSWTRPGCVEFGQSSPEFGQSSPLLRRRGSLSNTLPKRRLLSQCVLDDRPAVRRGAQRAAVKAHPSSANSSSRSSRSPSRSPFSLLLFFIVPTSSCTR